MIAQLFKNIIFKTTVFAFAMLGAFEGEALAALSAFSEFPDVKGAHDQTGSYPELKETDPRKNAYEGYRLVFAQEFGDENPAIVGIR